jgi:hypothetical protein
LKRRGTERGESLFLVIFEQKTERQLDVWVCFWWSLILVSNDFDRRIFSQPFNLWEWTAMTCKIGTTNCETRTINQVLR